MSHSTLKSSITVLAQPFDVADQRHRSYIWMHLRRFQDLMNIGASGNLKVLFQSVKLSVRSFLTRF